MMLGIAANNSVAKEIGLRRNGGHISVTNIATASARGTAMIKARIDEAIVPKRNGSAPNSPETGSHALPVKN